MLQSVGPQSQTRLTEQDKGNLPPFFDGNVNTEEDVHRGSTSPLGDR